MSFYHRLQDPKPILMMVLSKWLFPRLWEGFHVDLPALRIAIIAAFLALDLPNCSQVTSASSPSIVKVLPLQVDHDKLNYKLDAEPILLMSGRSTRCCCFLHLRGPSQVHNFATGMGQSMKCKKLNCWLLSYVLPCPSLQERHSLPHPKPPVQLVVLRQKHHLGRPALLVHCTQRQTKENVGKASLDYQRKNVQCI